MMKKVTLSILLLFTIFAALVSLPTRAAISSDVNGDGEINIADVNAVIDAILSANSSNKADVNGDGEVNIADVNAVIDKILNPDPNPGTGTDEPGLYMGITGFNQQLYTKDISLLNRSTKGAFTGFVSSLTTKDATVLYYAVDKSLDALDAAPFPKNLSNVALVTFTDGLDQGSLMLTDQGYTSDTQYATTISSRINGMTVHGIPLQAYTIGLKGSDVTNNEMFMSNLRSLASSEENVALINNMDEVKARFQAIADNLTQTSYSYSHMLTLTIPGVSNGTRIRFTFDNVDSSTVADSQKYIEGTFNLADRSLSDVAYHGMTSTSGATIRPKGTEGIFVTYAIDGLTFDDSSERINKNQIKEWYWVSDYSNWQINSEFTPGSVNNVDVEASYTSAIVMLVLDCSSSLSSDFDKLKNAANEFINTLADYDSYNPSESTDSYTVNGVSFRMIPVEGGTFTMGATAEQGSDAQSNESPAHQVTLNSFSIGQTEVTQELWKAVMGNSYTGDLKRPVENVSWSSCQTFITKLNEMTGENFRLPTEAEWEYAARGGKLSQGYKYAGSNSIDDVAWFSGNCTKPQPVALKSPNELGLYDMSGNVWEWCQDVYDYYSSDAQVNPTGPASGSYHVYRGGSWDDQASYCRVSYRDYNSSSSPLIGLRLAMYDFSSFAPLMVSTSSLQMTVGDQQSVSISGGSGRYAVNSTSLVTVSLTDAIISLTANTPGSTVITVTDVVTNEKASITITVKSPAPMDNNTTLPGLYMGITAFNKQLYTKDFSLLNRGTEGVFTGFVNSMTTMDGTVLYYAEEKSLDRLANAPNPKNLKNVVLVTFTDGLDQGSLMLTDKGYTSGTQYASALASRIGSMNVHGLTLRAYSIGLMGQDVTNTSMFMTTLRSLATSADNVYQVNNIEEVTSKFTEIASNLSMSSYSYSHTLTLTIPGISNGTRIRFTFDNVNNNTVEQSEQYIEGTFNLSNRSLTNVTYHGMSSSSGTTVMPKAVNGVYITYVFDDLILANSSEQIDKNKIQEWYWVPDYNKWQINSEFTPNSVDNVDVETVYSSAIVMLVLDCSSSLVNDFGKLKTAANNFIHILADYDSFTAASLSQSNVTMEIGGEAVVDIQNGSGNFSVSGGGDIVSARIDGSQLKLTGQKEGSATLTVTDISTQTSIALNVNVYDGQLFEVNGVTFMMLNVQGGTFTMGATAEQGSDAYSYEKPAHQVTLSSYSIGLTEVTQALWQSVMGSNPSYFTGDLNRPVEYVSWYDCQTFISKLNEMTGRRFRLPTEAEWEYAARGGIRSMGYKYAGSNTIDDVAWYSSNSSSKTHPVAAKAPNELGLYDMSGNVWEWVQDRYGSYTNDSQTNPTGPSSGYDRVFRGGSWSEYARDCRVSKRVSEGPSLRDYYLGLRLAL